MSTCNFKPVNLPIFCHIYDICDCGKHILNKNTSKHIYIRNNYSEKGFKEASLSHTNCTVKVTFKVHVLMGLTWIEGYDPEKHDIVHKDKKTSNNNLFNLEIIEKPVNIEIPCTLFDMKLDEHSQFDGLYKICKCGKHVVCIKTNKLLSQTKRSNGYYMVFLRNENEKKHALVHRLVASTFLEKPGPEYNQVDHLDRNRENNNAENLKYVTASMNMLNTEGTKKRSISQFTLDSTFIKEYESMDILISDNPHYSKIRISNCINCEDFMNIDAYGYKWRYTNENNLQKKFKPEPNEIVKSVEILRYYNNNSHEIQEIDVSGYIFTNFGRVVNKNNNKLLTPNTYNGVDVLRVSLWCSGIKKGFSLQGLIANVFNPLSELPQERMCIKFKDNNFRNCNADNLEWIVYRARCIEVRGKKVHAQSLQNPDETHTFNSFSEASDFLKEKFPEPSGTFNSSIRGCIVGSQKHAYGYVWTEV